MPKEKEKFSVKKNNNKFWEICDCKVRLYTRLRLLTLIYEILIATF